MLQEGKETEGAAGLDGTICFTFRFLNGLKII
jgi:hypothetical protein